MHTKPSLLNPTHGNSSNLDFIRSVAVLAVVLRHILGEWHIETLGPLRVQLLGIFGVMLFFVLTAHVLMLSLQRLQAAQPAGLAWRGVFLYSVFFVFTRSACWSC